MMIEIDFIAAVAIFMSIFIIIMSSAAHYFSLSTSGFDVQSLRNDANFILQMIYTNGSEMSLATLAYKIDIVANSNKDLPNELATFDVSQYSADYNSFVVFDPTTEQSIIPSGTTTKIFSYSIKTGETKRFYVYFDDDSSFASHAVSYTGSDDLTETIYPATTVKILQYNKIQALLAKNYNQLKTKLGLHNFNIKLDDIVYGDNVPEEGNVVSLARPVLYQKQDAGLGFAQFTVSVW